MSARGKGVTGVAKPKKTTVIKPELGTIETAFSKALADRYEEEPRMFAMSGLRRVVRGDVDDDDDGKAPKKRRGGLTITALGTKMFNSEVAGATRRIISEGLVYSKRTKSSDGTRMHVSLHPGCIAFGCMMLGCLPHAFEPYAFTPGGLDPDQEEEIRTAFVKLTANTEKKKKTKKAAAAASPSAKKT